MSSDLKPVSGPRRIPISRIVFPFVIIGLAVVALVVIDTWKDTDVDSSKLSMAKMVTVLFAGILLLLWALRMPGWKKRYVWLAFAAAVGLTFVFVRYDGMKGNFLPTFVARNWVQDAFFGGSPDTILEQHRQSQGKAEGQADLTEKPGDWPGYLGPNRDGVATGQRLARDWKKTPPREVWRQPVGGGWAAFSVANGFLVTIEQRRDREVVACYEAATGKEVWTAGWNTRFSESMGGDGPRATPAISGGDVFALGANGRLVCLDGKDGREKWAVETLADNTNVQWAQSGSPLVVDNLVVVNPGAQTEAAKGKAVRAYDRATGNVVWTAGNHPTGYSSPHLATLGGKKQVLIFDAAGLAGHDLTTGTELWRFSYPTFQGINVAQPVVMDESSIVVAAGYNVGGARIKVTESEGKWTATEVWRTKNSVMRWKFSAGVRRADTNGDYAYGLNDGHLECVDLKTGKAAWKDENRPREGEGIGFGQILLADDLIVAVTEKSGELVLVEATHQAFRELGRYKAFKRGSKTWNNLAIANGRVYIRNDEEMACFDLTGQ
jgi:outer membrane protein assembly factor BamB